MNVIDMIQIAENAGIFDDLAAVFSDMDRAYEESASSAGFSCTGCAESCCETRFYHFTWVEYLYLLKGLDGLDPDKSSLVGDRAKYVADFYRKGNQIEVPRIMCPVNEDGLCSLYLYRPMICRLHGIAHEFTMAGGKKTGPGCALFDESAKGRDIKVMDRTPFYTRLSMLEKRTRDILDQPGKIRMTVADMIASVFAEDKD